MVQYRKTRIVCISDTHNATPKLSKGDVLIHAGDLTNTGTFKELKKQVEWIEKADFEVKIVIAGNHDITLDEQFYKTTGHKRHGQNPQDQSACLSLLQNSPSITYLQHESREIRLSSSTGPRTHFTIFGSPYSPWSPSAVPNTPGSSGWAFQYPSPSASSLWSTISDNVDIVVTHTPPRYHCDFSEKGGGRAGCEELRRALWRVRPKLAVCGHVHGGRGVETARWDLRKEGQEEGCEVWEDPGKGNGKMSLVDLTGKGGRKLDNCDDREVVREMPVVLASGGSNRGNWNMGDNIWKEKDGVSDLEDPFSSSLAIDAGADIERALKSKPGRKETCIVNAAIKGNSHGEGKEWFNKPIVVDLYLPVWKE